jgi:biopolymer transport protein ExbD
MAFGSGQTGQSLNNEINVTPLVDVMLVMLIIFMLVTPMLQKGVGVDLPKAQHIEPVSEDKNQIVMVILRPNGDMFIGSDPVDRGALTRELKRRLDTNPALQLQVKADRNVPYGDVRKIMAAGRDAGYRGAALIAEELHPGQSAAAAPPAGVK